MGKSNKTKNYDVINPSTEEVCAVISLGSTDDTNLQLVLQKMHLKKWKETTKSERLELLEKLLSIYKSRWDEMTDAISTG